MKKVVILQHRLLHYRTAFFEKLKVNCACQGVQLHLVHGQATRREQAKKDEGTVAWADKVQNHVWEIGERDWIWQPFPAYLRDADLVVVMQENRILSNYSLLLTRLFGGPMVAYWGHGANFQSTAPNGLRERWKRLMLTRVDWWFAYTQMTVDIVKAAGYPSSQITSLENAIDTDGFKKDLAAVSDVDLLSNKTLLGISTAAPVGIFCGSLYPDKRLDFLVDVVDRIHGVAADFHCIVIGDGPSMPFMTAAAKTRPWLHLLGVKKGAAKALYFRMADFMLNPGAVGLHVVDAFCAGMVLLTTANARHGPEIAYLRHDENGYLMADSPAEYARTVLQLNSDPIQLRRLKVAALADSNRYTLENMAKNFTDGIVRCLNVASER